MNRILKKFIPGVILTIITVCLGLAFAARAQSTSTPVSQPSLGPTSVEVTRSVPPAPQYQVPLAQQEPQWAPASRPVIVCGECGAELGAPRQVLVAPATSSGCGYTLGRGDPRELQYVGQPYAEPVVYYTGGMPPPRPALPFNTYNVPNPYPQACPAGYVVQQFAQPRPRSHHTHQPLRW